MENQYILSCINGLPPSDAVIEYSCWLTKSLHKKLKLFHVLDQQYQERESDLSGNIGLGTREEMLEEIVEIEHQQNKLLQKKARLILDSAKEKAKSLGVPEAELCLRRGKLIENVMEFKDKVDVAVIGKYGKNHQDQKDTNAVGHKVEALVRTLRRPIFIVTEDFSTPKSICLAYDASEGANKTLDFICRQKGPKEMTVHLVFVGEANSEGHDALLKAQEKLKKNSIESEIKTLTGHVDEALLEYMEGHNIDILAMGAFGHHWLRDFVMGSVTSKVIKRIKRPLLLVR